MTKSEFVDKVAAEAGLSKKDAGAPSTPCSETIESELKRGGEVTFTGFGKFHVAAARRPRGSQPAHRRDDADRGDARSRASPPAPASRRPQVAAAMRTPRSRRRRSATGSPPRVASRDVPDRPRRLDPAAAASRAARVADRLRAATRDPAKLWPRRAPTSPRHCRAVIDAAGARRSSPSSRSSPASSASAPPAGPRSSATVEHARTRTACSSSLDGKRGDVPVTAAVYARRSSAHADAVRRVPGSTPTLTVNPLLGRDALEPSSSGARAGAGVFLLVRTSNPGAADVMDPELADGGRCGSASPRSPTSSGDRAERASRTSAPSPAPRSPSTSPACAS